MFKGHRFDPSLFQILSLYLVLLAFFVLLFSMSDSEPKRTEAAVKSVSGSFASITNDKGVHNPLAAAFGESATDPAFLTRAGKLVETVLPLAQVRVIADGKILEATFRAKDLFKPVAAEPMPSAEVLAQRIGALLSDGPAGVRYEAEVIAGTGAARFDTATRSRIALRRAARLAETIAAAGARTGSVAGGVDQSSADRIRILFYVRPAPRTGADRAGVGQ